MNPKCFKCEVRTKKVVNAREMYKGKYVLTDITKFVCSKCGEEYYYGEEYERIRKKIAALETEIPQKALAQAKVVIL